MSVVCLCECFCVGSVIVWIDEAVRLFSEKCTTVAFCWHRTLVGFKIYDLVGKDSLKKYSNIRSTQRFVICDNAEIRTKKAMLPVNDCLFNRQALLKDDRLFLLGG